MEQAYLSLVWWNTSLSPPTSKSKKEKFKIPKCERIIHCGKIIRQFMDFGYDFICLAEVSSNDIDSIIEQVNIADSNYTYISGYQKLGNMIFDTCILFNKNFELNTDATQVRNLVYSSSDRKVKTGQRFEFYLPCIKNTLVLYLSHWPSRQSADDALYNSIAQDLRGAVNSDLLLSHSVVLLGDYNVEPHHTSIITGLQASREKDLVRYRRNLLYNPCWKFLSVNQHAPDQRNRSGTYHLRKTGLFNDWHMIDQILISKDFLSKTWNFRDSYVDIIDTNSTLNDPISDHLAISILIERAQK